MQPKPIPDFPDAMTALESGIAEAKRHEALAFDGLLGNFDPASSRLLRDMISHLRSYLLERYSEDEARRLMSKSEPIPGFHAMPVVDESVRLAIDLLRMVKDASNCTGDKFGELIFGKAGSRDQKTQGGRRSGGRATGQARANEASARHAEWREYAEKLVAEGQNPREVAGIIANRHGVTARAVRDALKKRN